ncbi:MAG TPA: flagellar hook capping FlgD N-terminal domain-containing protein [Verrucomicrobiae bacterium]|jgi:flagellar basal-body rod modification protein FlgD
MSTVNSVTPDLATDSTTSPDTVSGPQQTLNQNDFLQLLVAQMENQDPLNPQSDTDMAAQMAQFTSLTQSSAMSSSLSMLQANSLIGSTVSLQVDPQTTASGVVQGVVLNGGTPQIIVNGTTYDLSQVTGVTPTATSQTSSSSPATN